MSDFLINFSAQPGSSLLLKAIQQPYVHGAPSGWARDYQWGGLALLQDKIAANSNLISLDGLTFGWVGDLAVSRSVLENKIAALTLAEFATPEQAISALQSSGLLDCLTGGFGAFLAGPSFAALITDPFASVQIYLARDQHGNIKGAGTHPDLTARCGSATFQPDPVSVAEFVNYGISCNPCTMHQTVSQLPPGAVTLFSPSPSGSPAQHTSVYWRPPSELHSPSIPDLQREFLSRWQDAVHRRMIGPNIGVQLSGGMDSRLVLASIPPEVECTTLTLCDEINREARIARKVAGAFSRPWLPLYRDPEYLASTAFSAIRFTGCEGEWHHGHMIGFSERLNKMGMNTIFTGLFMDNNFKGYYARDIVRIPRARGLLPPIYRPSAIDYASHFSPFCAGILAQDLQQGSVTRRRAFASGHFAMSRQSQWEWLDGYPLSQAYDNTGWVIERRFLPMRLPVMDRPLVDLAFSIPALLKADGNFFEAAAVQLFGPARNIVNANNGVRPASGHITRVAQRAVRKALNTKRNILGKLGFQQEVPHSWHDFQRYWRESSLLKGLRKDHGENLLQFKEVFTQNPLDLLHSPNIPFPYGYRLLQLAVWRSIVSSYQF